MEEIKFQYCHCFGIGEPKNQMRAFAVALIEELKLPSNNDFKYNIANALSQGKSFTRLQFLRVHCLDLSLERLMPLLEEIYLFALANLDQIDDCED